MSVVVALLRKQLTESRWALGLSAAGYFAIAVLTSWVVLRFERAVDTLGFEMAASRFRFLRALGGSVQDYSTTGMQVCWFNHPVVVLILLGWAVSRGSAAVAGEIERGTIDLTMSRPVSRSAYLTAQTLFAVLGMVALAAALVAGEVVGARVYGLKSPPTLWTLSRPAAMLVTLGMAVFGYTVPLSAVDVVRWRPFLLSAAVTLAGLIALSVAPLLDGYDWLKYLSVFQVYSPVIVALKGEPLAYNASVLCLVFGAGLAFSYWAFARRDLPSNS